jgi:hypothetical protein
MRFMFIGIAFAVSCSRWPAAGGRHAPNKPEWSRMVVMFAAVPEAKATKGLPDIPGDFQARYRVACRCVAP